MTTGIIGYLSARGLGTMTHDLRVQLGITHQMVPPDTPWPYVESWATGGEFYLDQWEVQREDLELWKDSFGIDTLISIETSYGDSTFRWAKELGMRTILIVMWEAFNPNMEAYRNVDLYVAPSFRAYQEIPFDNKIFLPYPVDTDLFQFKERCGYGKTPLFVHNAGSGGMNGRKGTLETLQAFHDACAVQPLDLLVRSQVPLETIVPEFQQYMARRAFRVEGPVENREDLYTEGDILVYPSRYDGHALVALEGMASGMPVITTNAAPMNEFWRPSQSDLLVSVEKTVKPAGLMNPHCFSEIVSIADLSQKMLWCADRTERMNELSLRNREIAENEYSWHKLKDRWVQKLGLEAK